MTIIASFIFAFIFTTCAVGVGSIFCASFDSKNSLKELVTRFAIGIGVYAYMILVIGLVTTKVNFLIVFLIIGLIGWIYRFHKKEERNSFLNSFNLDKENSLLEKLILIAILLIVLVQYIQAASPLIRWDAATHHYLVPRVWLDNGKITNIPSIVFAEYPSTIESLYMSGLQNFQEWGANTVGWLISVFLGLAILSFTRDRISRLAGLSATLIFFSMPLMLELFTGGLIDVGYTFFAWMSFWFFIEYREKKEKKLLYLSAIFAGWMLGSKHLGVEFIVALWIGVLWHYLASKARFISWLIDMLIFVLLAFVVALPWYLRSYFDTGNPIYPFLPALFNKMVEIKEPISVKAWSRPDYKRGLISLITYPWKLTCDFSFLDFWIMGISPVFLGSVPFWIIYRKRFPNGLFSILIPFNIVFLIIAYLIAPSATRYILPMLAVLSVVSASSLVFLTYELKIFGRTILVLALLIPFLLHLSVGAKRVHDVIPWFMGNQSTEDVFKSEYDAFDSIIFINDKLPKDAIVLSTDPKAYFIKRKFYVATPGAQSQYIPPWTEPDSIVILNGWKNLSITHILFNLSKNVMKNSYFVYTVTKGIEDNGELIMTAEELAELTKYETDYTYKPSEIAEFGRLTQTPTIEKDGKTYYHLYPEWWEKTVKMDKTQYMLRHYLELKPYMRELARFDAAIVYELEYPN